MGLPTFVGRLRELGFLSEQMAMVQSRGGGRLVVIRGRRQVGKSRLVSEFLRSGHVPHVFFTGSRQASLRHDLDRFSSDLTDATIPGLESFGGVRFDDWETALRAVVSVISRPSVVVLDEVPWLIENDAGLEGTLQKVWDRHAEQRPVLFLLVGSDLAMMDALVGHGRPLYGRARELVVAPFHLGEVAEALEGRGWDDAAAIDAYLITGGYPRLVEECGHARSLRAFLYGQLEDENRDLLVVGQRVLEAEFPQALHARQVLSVIGAGERTHKAVSQRLGTPVPATLSRSLDLLTSKGLVAREVPVSQRASNRPRYRVADPYLRLFLGLLEPALSDVARGRSDLARRRVHEGFPTFRGRSVEPLVHDALARLARFDERLCGAAVVGAYWTRAGDTEVDVVGVTEGRRSPSVCFLGSVKGGERGSFSRADADDLRAVRVAVPGGATAPLVGVSRRGFAPGLSLAAEFGPRELIEAFGV